MTLRDKLLPRLVMWLVLVLAAIASRCSIGIHDRQPVLPDPLGPAHRHDAHACLLGSAPVEPIVSMMGTSH